MRGSKAWTCCGLAVLMLAALPAMAQSDDPQARLRAALPQATSQLRDLEDQNATLLAKQAEAERARLALTQKLAEDEKALAAARGAAQNGQAAAQRAAEAQTESVKKWEDAYKMAADTARARDGDAKRLDAALAALREQTRLAEEKNAALYKLAEELLDLYEHKDALDSIAASEPVTKLKRVELENLMQDYEDKVRANHVVHPAPQ